MAENTLNTTDLSINTHSSILKTICSMLLLTLWCLLSIIVLVCWKLIHPQSLHCVYRLFHKGCCHLFMLRCSVSGHISSVKPTLFVSNHISYLDIFVLGQCIPAFFIAKSEVAHWPILGWLAKLQNTLFFQRNSQHVRSQIQTMSEHFDRRGNLILFPEGTSTAGEQVLPFKSSLLSSVELASETVWIQPVTIAYNRYNHKRMHRDIRDQYAWYATMPFASHWFHALGLLGTAEVALIFHPPVTLDQFADRKACAQHCHEQSASGLATALGNHP